MTSIQYKDFYDEGYKPEEDELVCEFYIEPAEDLSIEDAAGRVASESSNGTWSVLDAEQRIKDMSAQAFEIDGNRIKIAYKPIIFEEGNMPQILSCITGNIMGMKAVKRIRLLDVEWPESIVKHFKGPKYGSSVKKEIFDVERPITATVPKPKVGMTSEQHAQVGYDAWKGGLDLLKDDENLTGQSFNRFEKRIEKSFKLRDKAERETGEKKSYLVNITADTQTMLERAEMVKDLGGEYIMIDIITAGWAGLQAVRQKCEELDLAIHAHRAMHAAFDRIPTHGVSMRCIAQFSRIIGVDQIHTGTANLGKLDNEDTVGINEWLRKDLHGLKDVLPVASGGLHPGTLPMVFDKLGTNIAVQVGGGVHGHPGGTYKGAMAMKQAINAYMDGKTLEEAAENHEELKKALDKWGSHSPR